MSDTVPHLSTNYCCPNAVGTGSVVCNTCSEASKALSIDMTTRTGHRSAEVWREMVTAAVEEWDSWAAGGNQGTTECFEAVLRKALARQVGLCSCGDRPSTQCPGEWEPGCDLGANPAYVVSSVPRVKRHCETCTPCGTAVVVEAVCCAAPWVQYPSRTPRSGG